MPEFVQMMPSPARLIQFYGPILAYILSLGAFLRLPKKQTHHRILATYLLICIGTTLILDQPSRWKMTGPQIVLLFRPIETFILALFLETTKVLPKSFSSPVATPLLLLAPWFALAISDPEGFSSFRHPHFHLLTLFQIILCLLALARLASGTTPLTQHSTYWFAIPMLFNGAITLMVFLWITGAAAKHPELTKGFLHFRAFAIMVLYAMMGQSFRCPYPTSTSLPSA